MKEEQELLALKTKIDSAKTEKNLLEGRLLALKDRLKSEFGVDSIEDAEKKLADMIKEADSVKNEVVKGLEGLQRYA